MNFACKKISLKDILSCLFNLNKTSFNVLMIILKEDKLLSINEISKKVKLTNSSVQKAVKQLLSKKLINRHQRNRALGGYYFTYYIKDKVGFKRLLIKKINEWAESVNKQLQQL